MAKSNTATLIEQEKPASVVDPAPMFAEPLPAGICVHADVLYWSFDRDELVSLRGIIVAKMPVDPNEFVLSILATTGDFWSPRVAKYSSAPKANFFTKFKPV